MPCARCGGPTEHQNVLEDRTGRYHRHFPDCIAYLKSENERLTKLAAEAFRVRDAAREQSNKDLASKRSALDRLDLVSRNRERDRSVMIDIRSFFGKDEDFNYKLHTMLPPELRDRLIEAIGNGIQ